MNEMCLCYASVVTSGGSLDSYRMESCHSDNMIRGLGLQASLTSQEGG